MIGNEGQRRLWNDPGWVKRWLDVEGSAAPVTGPLIEAAAVRPGEIVLDIGCGGGLTTVAAASAAGSAGSVVGIDLSEPLLDLGRRRGKEAGVENVRFAAGDAQADDFPGGPFDVAISRFGVMFFTDPPAAFGNISRQMKRGARLAMACWQRAEKNPWFVQPILERYRPPAPAQGGGPPPGPLAFADPDYVSGILAAGGFGDVASAEHTYTWRDRPGSLSDPRSIAGMDLEPARAEEALAELRALEQRFTVDGEVVTQRVYFIYTARKA